MKKHNHAARRKRTDRGVLYTVAAGIVSAGFIIMLSAQLILRGVINEECISMIGKVICFITASISFYLACRKKRVGMDSLLPVLFLTLLWMTLGILWFNEGIQEIGNIVLCMSAGTLISAALFGFRKIRHSKKTIRI